MTRFRTGCRLLLALLIFGFHAFPVHPALPAPSPARVSLQLRWDHQYQFAGYYCALWRGYYDESGLQVEIRGAVRPDASIISAVSEVSSGAATFGIGAADILTGDDSLRTRNPRSGGLSVLASIFQRSAARFYSLKDSGISSPADLAGKMVARMSGDLIDIEFMAMLRNEGVDAATFRSVPHTPGVRGLKDRKADLLPGYTISLPYEASELGLDVEELDPRRYGVEFYGDSIFALHDWVTGHPELARAFVDASIKGWKWALEHPEETADEISRRFPRISPVSDFTAFNRFQSTRIQDLVLYPVVALGSVNPERWKTMYNELKAAGIVRQDFRPHQFVLEASYVQAQKDRRLHDAGVIVLVLVSLLLAFGILWNVSLKKEVGKKTLLLQGELSMRRETEKKLTLLNEELELRVSERTEYLEHSNEELRDFARSISNEIRTPLRATRGFAEMLKIRYLASLDAEALRLLGKIITSSQRIEKIMEQVLSLYELERTVLKPVRIDVSETARRLVHEMKETLQCPPFEIEISPGIETWADKTLFSILLSRLLSNAMIHGMGHGGHRVRIGIPEGSREKEFFVQDDGPGFDPQDAEDLFKPFVRLNKAEETPGTGMGLAVARRIVARHGGSIRTESNPGEGATFYIALPWPATGSSRPA